LIAPAATRTATDTIAIIEKRGTLEAASGQRASRASDRRAIPAARPQPQDRERGDGERDRCARQREVTELGVRDRRDDVPRERLPDARAAGGRALEHDAEQRDDREREREPR
jgi:hypothetical protein